MCLYCPSGYGAKTRFTQSREIQTAETKTAQAVPSHVFKSSGKTTWRTAPTGIGGTGRTGRQSARSGGKAVKETLGGHHRIVHRSAFAL